MKHRNDNSQQYTKRYITFKHTIPYLITIRKHQTKDYVSMAELEEVKGGLSNTVGTLEYYAVERHGRYKQLHAHGIILLPRTTRYGLYTKYNNFRIHYQRIESYIGAIKYIFKHYNKYSHTQLDTELSNYFAYHYAF